MRREGLGRAVLTVAAVAALSGCHKEPDFDERFTAAQDRIAHTAAQIQAQVDATGAPTPLAEQAQ